MNEKSRKFFFGQMAKGITSTQKSLITPALFLQILGKIQLPDLIELDFFR